MPEQRPSKKQFETLEFIRQFIAGSGYGPSYREIMKGCGYTSVATVALHVNNLIAKGRLRKKDRSARSLEVVGAAPARSEKPPPNHVNTNEEKWLVERVEAKFRRLEQNADISAGDIDELQVLVKALSVLGFTSAAQSFTARLSALKLKTGPNFS